MNASTLQTQNRRILTVDDNMGIHEDYRKVLCTDNKLSGEFAAAEARVFGSDPAQETEGSYIVEAAQQGQIAARMVTAAVAADRPYAMAFVDMRMPPGWDGIETIEHMWQDDPNIEIVICTAYADYSWEEVFARLGRTNQLLVLKKPFDPVEVKQLACSLTAKWELAQRFNSQSSIVTDQSEFSFVDETAKLLERYRELASWLHSRSGLKAGDEVEESKAGIEEASRLYDEMVGSLALGVEAFGEVAKETLMLNERHSHRS